MTYEPPPLQRPEDMPALHTQDDLCQRWRALMGEPGYSQAYLWFFFVEGDGHMVPHLNQVEGMPATPSSGDCAGVIGVFDSMIKKFDTEWSVAVLVARPGGPVATTADREWARGLTREARRQSVRMWPVHVANDFDLRAITPDELIAA